MCRSRHSSAFRSIAAEAAPAAAAVRAVGAAASAAAAAPAAAAAAALAAAPAADPWIYGSIPFMMNHIFYYEMKNKPYENLKLSQLHGAFWRIK